jgi:outer membrane protein TolC
MKFTPSVFVSLVLLSSAAAQALTLNQALEESQKSSLQVQKAESSYEEAKWRKLGAYSGFLPTLSLSANYLTSKKYMLVDIDFGGNTTSIPQIIPSAIYTLKASYPLFDGFASTNRFKSESSLEESALDEYHWTKFTVERQTILQFYRSLSSQILKDVAEQNLKALQDHLKDIQAFKRAGVSTNYDVLRVETQVSEAQSELLNSADNMELSKYKLGEALGKEIEDRPLDGKLPVPSEDMIRALKPDAIENRLDLKALREKSEASRLNYQSTNKYWAPRISLVGEYNRYNNLTDSFNDNDAFRDAYWTGVNLSWTLFDGLAATSRSGQSEQQALQMEKNLSIARIKAKQDFEFWRRKFIYFCTVYKARSNDIERSQEAVRLAKVGRHAGVRTSTELLDAESDLFRSRAGLVTAQMGAVEALINLELVSGQKLFDFR